MSSRTAAYYRANPEARAKRQRAQAEINRRPSERRRRAELKRDSVWAAGFCL